jgi:two-component system, NtrC family, response regulator GlrR
MRRQLLLVDDDRSLLKLLSIRLEAEGFRVHTAESSDQAIQVLRNEAIDLMLTDLRMEGASGLELFEQARHFYPGLPVIIMSAQGTIPEAVTATQMGVFQFAALRRGSGRISRELARTHRDPQSGDGAHPQSCKTGSQ